MTMSVGDCLEYADVGRRPCLTEVDTSPWVCVLDYRKGELSSGHECIYFCLLLTVNAIDYLKLLTF